MTPFIIVADMRTGSTLLSTTLDTHPHIRCYGELLHPENLPDNQVPGYDRYKLSGGELIQRALKQTEAKAIGFRAMVFLPAESQPQWGDAWTYLSEMNDLHVIYLTRRDQLAQYASTLIAHQTGAYHPYSNDPILKPENRPSITIDPEEFERWVSDRNKFFTERRQQLSGKPSLDLEYETLVANWSSTMQQVQEFLDVDVVQLDQIKQKQETRSLSEVITNYGELVKFARRHSA